MDKNNIFINMDYEFYFMEKLNKSNYYLISKKLIEIYADVFSDYDKINIKKRKSNDLDKLKFNGLKLKFIYESELSPATIKDLIPNFIKDLDKELKFYIIESFSVDEIINLGILEIEDDIMSNNLTKEPKYNKFKNGNVFVSNDCFFIDKYGKIYYKTFIKYIIF